MLTLEQRRQGQKTNRTRALKKWKFYFELNYWIRIRIRIETNAYPQQWSQNMYLFTLDSLSSEMCRNDQMCPASLCGWTEYRQSAKLFLQSSELGLPTPHPPPFGGGEGTLACGRGVGGVPIRWRDIHYGALYI
jgi:hypothetical protein